jgi:AraC family transcriptional regulator
MAQTKMRKLPSAQLQPPRLEDGKALLIAGLHGRYTNATLNTVPDQWQRFLPHIGKVPGQVGRAAYGVSWCAPNAPDIEYLTGVEVSGFAGVPSELSVVSIPAQKYAVFAHNENVSKLHDTLDAISHWLPQSGYQPASKSGDAPDFFERYAEDFNPQTGMGGIEVWVPIQP